MPGSLPTNIKLLPPQHPCFVLERGGGRGDFITTGTSATLCLPLKPPLTMELDLSSHLPYCTATKSSTVLAQGQQVNLCVTAAAMWQTYFDAQNLLITLPTTIQTILPLVLSLILNEYLVPP